jgi:hypothetical protein
MNARTKRLYWQATALLLATHFAGWPPGLAAVIALNVVQPIHFLATRRSLLAFDVQVRIGYLLLLLLGSVGPLWPLLVVQFVGVNGLLVADYCPLARMLLLLPWNRTQPLSLALVRWIALAPPRPGSIADRLPAERPGVPAARQPTRATL